MQGARSYIYETAHPALSMLTKSFSVDRYRCHAYEGDIIIADEPTNNIDISCMDILADTLKNYVGTLLIVSHDEQFIHDIGIKRIISIS